MFSTLLSLAVFGAMPMLSDEPPRPPEPPGDRPRPARATFDELDRNNDGLLDRDEFRQAGMKPWKQPGVRRRGRDAGPPPAPEAPQAPRGANRGVARMPEACPSLPEDRPRLRRDGSCRVDGGPMIPMKQGLGPRRPDGPREFGRPDGPDRGGQVARAVRLTLKRHRGEIDRMINQIVREAVRDLRDGPAVGKAGGPQGPREAFGFRGDRPGPAARPALRERRIDRWMKRHDANCDGCISRDEFRGPPGPRGGREADRAGRPEPREQARPLPPRGRPQPQDGPHPEPNEMDE
jgi:hypothetical protein